MKSNQNLTSDDLVTGDTWHFTFTVEDGDAGDGSAKDLTGASITWVLTSRDRATTHVTKTTGGGGVTIADATGGTFRVELTPSETADLDGTYRHEAEVTDSNGHVSTVARGAIDPSPDSA